MRKHFLNRRGMRHVANQKPGRIRTSYGSPGRGAGPATAGSEGSGFSLEKPPPEAEFRPGYPKSLVFAPTAQGLAEKAKPDPSVSCAASSAVH